MPQPQDALLPGSLCLKDKPQSVLYRWMVEYNYVLDLADGTEKRYTVIG